MTRNQQGTYGPANKQGNPHEDMMNCLTRAPRLICVNAEQQGFFGDDMGTL